MQLVHKVKNQTCQSFDEVINLLVDTHDAPCLNFGFTILENVRGSVRVEWGLAIYNQLMEEFGVELFNYFVDFIVNYRKNAGYLVENLIVCLNDIENSDIFLVGLSKNIIIEKL